ncbi:MAG: nucleoside kinase [Dialister sp.]|nr:nucleoside kinase [Dialister sp.]
MQISCEGQVYELKNTATPQDLWDMVRGNRSWEDAVLADCEGDIIDFQTPFPGDTAVKWIPMNTPAAYRAYQRSLIMLLVIAVKEIYGEEADVKVKHTLGSSLYCEFSDSHVPFQKELEFLYKRMKAIVQEGRDISLMTVTKKRAEDFLIKNRRIKDAELLSQINTDKINVSQCGNYVDYFFGPMLPDMSYAKVFDLKSYAPGFLLQMPPRGSMELQKVEEAPLFSRVFLETQNWSELIGCNSLIDLNKAIENHTVGDLILMAEAFHEKKIAELADKICGQKPEVRLVCIAGPSSSGKTTFMKRLIIHLWVNGVKPVMLSLDDYFRNRDEMDKSVWEDLEALDLPLFEETVVKLLEGKEVRLPRFNFITGKKEWDDKATRLGEGQPILVEGLHGLNPALSYFVPGYQCVHVYLSALTQITINNHNRISTSDTRLLRRMVRDARGRGHDVETTLAHWDSVRQGEERNIFSFQNKADFIFNSALIYELPVLKKLAKPLLQTVSKGSSVYPEAQRLLHFLEPFCELDTSLVPSNSLLREFVGHGNV